jgi:Chloroplast import apparatus Tic20-like/EF-hand domain pair
LFVGNVIENNNKYEDDPIQRMRAMAQKLRAEAAALEADRAKERADATASIFRKFDQNRDEKITVEELQAGLEKVLKTTLPRSQVQALLQDLDVSGDGVLQLDEFISVDQLGNRLGGLARDEKQKALSAEKEAQKEVELAKLAAARMDLINDKEPTTVDKAVSVLPYLFPLLDSVQFGSFLLLQHQDNPAAIALATTYAIFRSIPLSGFLTFWLLSVLSSNPSLNRQVRFNMLQATFLDIALVIPGLLATLISLIPGASTSLPPGTIESGATAVFGLLLMTILYTSVSSVLGITPDKIPFISQAVQDRMPTLDMFDENGQFIPRYIRDEKKRMDDEKKKNNKD